MMVLLSIAWSSVEPIWSSNQAVRGDPPVAGEMTARSVCLTAGYLFRQHLRDNFQTINHECHVTRLGGGGVQVESG